MAASWRRGARPPDLRPRWPAFGRQCQQSAPGQCSVPAWCSTAGTKKPPAILPPGAKFTTTAWGKTGNPRRAVILPRCRLTGSTMAAAAIHTTRSHAIVQHCQRQRPRLKPEPCYRRRLALGWREPRTRPLFCGIQGLSDPAMPSRGFPPPWSVEKTDAHRPSRDPATSTSRTSPVLARQPSRSRATRPGASPPTSPSCQAFLRPKHQR